MSLSRSPPQHVPGEAPRRPQPQIQGAGQLLPEDNTARFRGDSCPYPEPREAPASSLRSGSGTAGLAARPPPRLVGALLLMGVGRPSVCGSVWTLAQGSSRVPGHGLTALPDVPEGSAHLGKSAPHGAGADPTGLGLGLPGTPPGLCPCTLTHPALLTRSTLPAPIVRRGVFGGNKCRGNEGSHSPGSSTLDGGGK